MGNCQKIPRLCKNPAGYAFVYEGRKKVYLGRAGTAEAAERYAAYCAAIVGDVKRSILSTPATRLSCAELAAAFLIDREGYYVKDGAQTGQIDRFKTALSFLVKRYPATPAAQIGPRRLSVIRDDMIDSGRFCRSYINTLITCLRGVYRWAVERELVDAETLRSLQALEPLKRGRTSARERVPVGAVDPSVVDATVAQLSSVVGDMVRLQALTGLRPGEVCAMRAGDLSADGDRLVYTLRSDKTAWRRADGDRRRIPLGPRAAALLAPYLISRADDEYIFQPAEAVAEHNRWRRAARKTPLKARQSDDRRKGCKYTAHYTTDAYSRAVARAAARAGVERWSPNMLRHLFATRVRAAFGLEAAQVMLGHARADVTQIYAERDFNRAVAVAEKIG